jgi:hypothetical protein
MARGRTAPLSPNEEVSLRRVAFGISKQKGPPDPTMARALTRGSSQEAARPVPSTQL